MELAQLRYFVAVAQTQHLTRAAEQLHISQPALSKAISRLEAELGTTIFDRSANRITLNPTGELYLQYVQDALSALDSGMAAIQSQSGSVAGDVSIMTSCSSLLQPAIRAFLTEHKQIRYQQYRFSADLIADQLEGRSVDFAVSTTPMTSVKFSWTSLVQDELCVMVSDQHPFASRQELTMEDLKDQPLIISNNLLSIHDIIVDGFAAQGLRPDIAYELNNPPLTEQLLRENRGIAFMPCLHTDPLPGASEFIRIPIAGHPFRYELGILKLRGRFQRPAARILEQHLIDWFSAPHPESGIPSLPTDKPLL